MKRIIFIICAILITGYAGAQTKTAMKAADLNKEITDYIAKSYAGYTTSQAYKIETNKVVTYQVAIQKDNMKKTLVFNDKGGFIKAEANKVTAVKPANTTKPVDKPKPNSTPAKAKEKSAATPAKN